MRVLKLLNNLLFYGYALFLVTAGSLVGLLAPTWGTVDFEVYATVVFKHPFEPEVLANALNQYRFMKSLEFGFGVFMLLFRREIYTQHKANRFFLSIVFLGAAVRAFSVLVDGTPHWAYIVFIIFEFSIFLVVFLYSRYTLKSHELQTI